MKMRKSGKTIICHLRRQKQVGPTKIDGPVGSPKKLVTAEGTLRRYGDSPYSSSLA